jgi:hypothetical protein
VDIPPAQRLTNRQKKCAPIGTSRPGILCSSRPLRRSAACANLSVGLARAMGKLAGRKTGTMTRYVPTIAIIDGSSRAYGGIVLDFPRCDRGSAVERRQGRAALGEEEIADGEELQRFGRSVAHPVVVQAMAEVTALAIVPSATRARASGQSQSVDRWTLMRPPQRVG